MKRATKITCLCNWAEAISIHALVKRATLCLFLQRCQLADFNPRPREEGDKIFTIDFIFMCHFNPRPREEGDLNCLSASAPPCQNFNPRPREEGDNIHRAYNSRGRNFNPRPREEGDSGRCSAIYRLGNFNPRPREEGDTPKMILK